LVDDWIKKNDDLKLDEAGNAKNFTFLTCGDWDLKTMLPSQCRHFNLAYPNYFKKWINVKKVFVKFNIF
jgi:hypothetical protein